MIFDYRIQCNNGYIKYKTYQQELQNTHLSLRNCCKRYIMYGQQVPTNLSNWRPESFWAFIKGQIYGIWSYLSLAFFIPVSTYFLKDSSCLYSATRNAYCKSFVRQGFFKDCKSRVLPITHWYIILHRTFLILEHQNSGRLKPYRFIDAIMDPCRCTYGPKVGLYMDGPELGPCPREKGHLNILMGHP